MSIKVINLNKLLRICASPEGSARSMLRQDLRQERDKLLGKKNGGGHFQNPWWEVAKEHAIGLNDLQAQLPDLILGGRGRGRLYPLYTTGYLTWLERTRRFTNQKFQWVEEEVHTHYAVPGWDLIVKVDNLLALRIGDESHKLVYPYFAEAPILNPVWGRVGLWLMSQALSSYSLSDMEILDVLRGASFSGARDFLRGNEQSVFASRYEDLIQHWRALRPEYGLPRD